MYMFDLSVGTPEHKFWSVFKGNVSEQESHQCSPLLKCEKSLLLSHHLLLCILHNVLLPTSTFNLINLHYSRQTDSSICHRFIEREFPLIFKFKLQPFTHTSSFPLSTYSEHFNSNVFNTSAALLSGIT